MFIDVTSHILYEGFAIENLNVTSQTDVKTAYAFHATDIGGEVPDVLVVLVCCNEILGSGEFLDEQVLGHKVELQRDSGCGVGIDILMDMYYYDLIVVEGFDVQQYYISKLFV